MFCGFQCEDIVYQWIQETKKVNGCQWIIRGHINYADYMNAALRAGISSRNVMMYTILRNPIKRVLSEFVHITQNLQGDNYGKAWDYTFMKKPATIQQRCW